jgi:hypothetical protein
LGFVYRCLQKGCEIKARRPASPPGWLLRQPSGHTDIHFSVRLMKMTLTMPFKGVFTFGSHRPLHQDQTGLA